MKKKLSCLILLLVTGLLSVTAQPKLKFSVVSFEVDPFDLTAQQKEYEKIDGSGARKAIIKVTSNNPDDDLKAYHFNFGNLSHEVVERDQELWIYVQKNAKMVTISRAGYATINRYDLKMTIEAGKTYLMQLSTTGPTVYTQMVKFSVKPATINAAVMIKGPGEQAKEELLGNVDQTGAIAKSLPLGTYTYKVMATDYHTSEGRFTLSDRSKIHEEEVIMRPNFSEVTLRVDADAEIYVNDELKGRREWKGTLKAGNYQVECRQEKHRNSSQYITIEDNKDCVIDLERPTQITGTLAVTSRPLGADIRIDGKAYGKTPQNINDLLIGSHKIEFSLRNYKTETREFEIAENQTSEVDVELKDVARMTINSNPTSGLLYINGKKTGQTPYTEEMASGDYDIKIVHSGYQDFSSRIHLDSSQPSVTFALRRLLVRPTQGYLQAGFQAGSFMGFGVSAGCYLKNINAEASYLLGISKSETVYWAGDDSNGERQLSICEYKPTGYDFRLGYGIISGTSLRFTPQAGVRIVTIKSDDGSSKANALSGCLGVKAEYALMPSVGLFLSPELAIALKQSCIFEQLATVSSKVKSWGSGFNVRAGVSISF